MIGIQEGLCVSGVRAAGRIEALRLQLQISQSMYPDFMPEYVGSGTFIVSSRSRTAAGTSADKKVIPGYPGISFGPSE